MASMPAWRAINPLPTLESLTGADENDTETRESIVDEPGDVKPANARRASDKAT